MNKIYQPYNYSKPKESPMASILSYAKEPLSQDIKVCRKHITSAWKIGYPKCYQGFKRNENCEELVDEEA